LDKLLLATVRAFRLLQSKVRLDYSKEHDQQGKLHSPLDRVVDSTLIEEVLRERR